MFKCFVPHLPLLVIVASFAKYLSDGWFVYLLRTVLPSQQVAKRREQCFERLQALQKAKSDLMDANI